MATNGRQDDKFLREVVFDKFSSGLLQEAIDWIANNLEPEDVFEKERLARWAEENGYVKAEDQCSQS